MNLFKKYWKRFNLKQASYLAFLLLSFLMPIGTKKMWESSWTYPAGDLVDYNSYFLYLTDILLILTLVLWVGDLMWQFYQRDDWDDWLLDAKRGLVLLLFGILVFWGFSSINWSDAIFLSWYRVGKMILMSGLLVYFLLFIKDNFHKWLGILVALMAGGFIQVIWGGWQYIWQKGLGLWWLGESVIGPDVDGVAKIDVAGEKIVRAYGSLSHANVFGLFMLFVLTALIIFFLLWQNNLKQKIFTQFINIDSTWFILSGMILSGILLSFSRSVWLSTGLLSVGFVYVFWQYYCRHQTGLTKWWLAVIIPLLVLLTNFPAIVNRSDLNIKQDVSVNTREVYDGIADRMIDNNYYIGVGLGNFVMRMPEFYGGELQWWMYEPVHNTFKLVWAELGVIGFILYSLIWLMVALIIFLENKGWNRWWWLLIWLIFFWLNLVDHYFWDNWTGQMILIYVWGMMLVVPGITSNSLKVKTLRPRRIRLWRKSLKLRCR